MDVGELVIKIRATAEDVDTAVQGATQKVQQFAKSVEATAGKPFKLDVKAEGLKETTSQVRDMSSAAQEAAKPITVAVDAPDLPRVSQMIQMFKANLSDLSAAAGELDIGELDGKFEGIEQNLSDAAKALEEGNSQLAETLTAVAGVQLDQVEKVVEEAATAESAYDKIGEAAREAGLEGASAGAQSAAGAAAATVSTVVWANAVKMLKRAMTGLGMSLLVTPIMNGIKDWVGGLTQAREETERLRQDQTKASEEAARKYSDSAAKIREYAKEYVELRNKQRSVSEETRFLELQSELAGLMGTTTDAIYAQAASLDTWSAAAETASKKQAELALGETQNAAGAKRMSAYEQLGKNYNLFGGFSGFNKPGSFENPFRDLTNSYNEYMDASMESMRAGLLAKGKEINESLYSLMADASKAAMESTLKTMDFSQGKEAAFTQLEKAKSDIISGIEGLFSGDALTAAIGTQAGLYDRVLYGKMTKEQAVLEATSSGQAIRDSLLGLFEGIYGKGDIATGLADQLYSSLAPLAKFEQQAGGLEKYFDDAAKGVGFMGKEIEGFVGNFDKLKAKAQSVLDMKSLTETTRKTFEAFKTLNAEGKDTGVLLGVLNEYGRTLGMTMDLTASNTEEWGKRFEELDNTWSELLLGVGDDYQKFIESVRDADKALMEGGLTNAEWPAHEAFQAILSDGEAAKELFTSLGEFDGIISKLLSGDIPPEEAASAMTTALDSIREAATRAFEDFGMDADAAQTAAARFASSLTDGKGVQEFATSLQTAGGAVDALNKQWQSLDGGIKKATALKDNVKNAKDAISAYKGLSTEMKKNPAEIEKVNKAVGKLGQSFDGSGKSLKNAEKGIDNFKSSLTEQAKSLENDIANMEAEFAALGDAAYVNGVLTANASDLLAKIATSKAALADLIAQLKAAGLFSGGGGGGGGGKKNKAEEARRAAEQARKQAIDDDYAMIAHKRHMNEITLEMELRMLNEIRDKHRLNAEEIMEWEEKIYDLKQEIRQRDAGSIDRVGDALITALEARYQSMLDAEVERLDVSRQAWQDWRDDSVKAIQDQIAALDELSKTENREKTDQEELRKIAKLRQDIEFEQDDYNRMKLQQQLDQAISAREDRLLKQERDDLKAALREQITAIEERADAEIKALDQEQADIEKAYADQMKSASLRAEAEKMLMKNNQKEIISLIGEYAPDYDALGKTLGEKLLDGFTNKVGNIVTWFAGLNNALNNIQQAAAADAIAASNTLYKTYQQNQSAEAAAPPATVVNQTVNFNEPVESAGAAAKRIAQANEELGAILYGG